MEHFILEEVDIKSVRFFSLRSPAPLVPDISLAVMKPLSFFASAIRWICEFIYFLLNLNLMIS